MASVSSFEDIPEVRGDEGAIEVHRKVFGCVEVVRGNNALDTAECGSFGQPRHGNAVGSCARERGKTRIDPPPPTSILFHIKGRSAAHTRPFTI